MDHADFKVLMNRGASGGGGGVVPPTAPLAVADYKNGIYSIGGVSKTYAQMWTNGGYVGPPFGTPIITPGVGWEAATVNGVFTNFYAQATPELFAALNVAAGVSFIMDFYLDADAAAKCNMNLGAVVNDTTKGAWVASASCDSTDIDMNLFGDYYGTLTDTESFMEGQHRAAASFSLAELAISTDGGPNMSCPTDGLAVVGGYYYNSIMPDGRGEPYGLARGVIQKITYYPLIPSAQLPTYSA